VKISDHIGGNTQLQLCANGMPGRSPSS